MLQHLFAAYVDIPEKPKETYQFMPCKRTPGPLKGKLENCHSSVLCQVVFCNMLTRQYLGQIIELPHAHSSLLIVNIIPPSPFLFFS